MISIRAITGAALALLLCVGAARAGPFEDGSAAYGRGDYAGALRVFRSTADPKPDF